MTTELDRQTTERFEARRALFLERLIRVWDQVPQKRLGELIVLTLDMGGGGSSGHLGEFDIEVLRNIDDVTLVERMERWLMLLGAE